MFCKNGRPILWNRPRPIYVYPRYIYPQNIVPFRFFLIIVVLTQTIVVLAQTTGLLNHLKPLLCYVMLINSCGF